MQYINPLQAISYGTQSTFSFIVLNYVGLYKLIMKPEQLKSNLGSRNDCPNGTTGCERFQFSDYFSGFNKFDLDDNEFIAHTGFRWRTYNFAFLEGIFGKPVPIKVQALLQRVGFALLLLL